MSSLPAPWPAEASASKDFTDIATEVGRLVADKNAAYGSAFEKAGKFLLLLFPEGIVPAQYGHALLLVRIFDKMMRIATDKDAFGESPYMDIAGYGILGVSMGTIKKETPADQRERWFGSSTGPKAG